MAHLTEKGHICPVDKCGLFPGAGDRTRTGTPSLAADFEGIDSFGIQWNRVEPSGVFHLTKHTKPVPFHLKKLDF